MAQAIGLFLVIGNNLMFEKLGVKTDYYQWSRFCATGGRTAKGIRTANGIYSNMARKYCVILGTINPTLAY